MLLRLPACLLAILVLSGGAPRPAHCKRVRAQRKARKAATGGAGAGARTGTGAGAGAAGGGAAARAAGGGATAPLPPDHPLYASGWADPRQLSIDEIFKTAAQHGKAGESALAAEGFAVAVAALPTNPVARLNLAMACEAEGEIGTSLESFKHVADSAKAPAEHRALALERFGTLSLKDGINMCAHSLRHPPPSSDSPGLVGLSLQVQHLRPPRVSVPASLPLPLALR